MKLQKQLSRKIENKEYPKYVVTIPPKQIKEVNWEEGIELEATVKNGKIELQGDHKQKVKEYLVQMGFAENTIEI